MDPSGVYNERVAIALGLVTLISALLAFLSCRTCVSWLKHIGIKDPVAHRSYAAFYRYHIYYWWSFGVILVAHLMMAVIHTGLPQANEPDASVHWRILGLGLLSAVAGVVIFSSCRVLPRIIIMATRKNPVHNVAYTAFFQKHSYYWGILAFLVLGHLWLSISHAGFWPTI